MTDFFSIHHILIQIGGYGVSYIEALAIICGLCCVTLASMERPSNFLWGIISFALFIVMFAQKGFVSSVIYHIFLIVFSIYGYWAWKFPKRDQANEKNEQKIRSFNRRQWLVLVGVLIAATALWGSVVYRFADRFPLMDVHYDKAYEYFQDAFMLVGTIVAQWLLSRKNSACWLVYVFVDGASVLLYWGSGTLLTSSLHLIYIGIAISAYIRWRKALLIKDKQHTC